MNKIIILLLTLSPFTVSFCQKVETVYVNKKDSTADMYIAVAPQTGKTNDEVQYMIDRIEKEMGGTPVTALKTFYDNSPYSYSDTTQKAIKPLIKTPIRIISEPDIQWWLNQRGYDYSYINIADQAAMINELRRLGNDRAVLITTVNKGYRKLKNVRHPHAWRIADPEQTIRWLQAQK